MTPTPAAATHRPRGARQHLRAVWGVAPDVPLVALIGAPGHPDTSRHADVLPAALALGLIRLAAGRPVRLLIDPRQRQRHRAQNRLNLGDAEERVMLILDAGLTDPRLAADRLAAADAVLFADTGRPPPADEPLQEHLLVAAARDAGRPAVAPDTPEWRRGLTPWPAAVAFAPPGSPQRTAHYLQHAALGLGGRGPTFRPPAVPGMNRTVR